MFRKNSTIAQRISNLSDKKSGIISIAEKLVMGLLLCTLMIGVHYGYKKVHDRYLLAKSKIEAGTSTLNRIAAIYGVKAPVWNEEDASATFSCNSEESPAAFVEMNEAEMVIVVPEIERSAGERKKVFAPVRKNKCNLTGERENCEHNKTECCTKKTGTAVSDSPVIKENQTKKKPGSTRKTREISEQKHFGVGLKFTV